MNNPAAANRVATMIATFKWILIGLIALGVLVGVIGGFAAADDGGIFFSFMALVMGAVYAVVTYVMFGWFEQTLRMLASIAANTGSNAAAHAGPPSDRPVPPYGS